jgi:hypothetical protein
MAKHRPKEYPEHYNPNGYTDQEDGHVQVIHLATDVRNTHTEIEFVRSGKAR